MDKLKLHTPDLTAGNVERIAVLFPNCVTEATDETGKLKRAIDFDLLKQELSADLVEGPQERFRLDWPGKREALALANTPVALTLRPCRDESVDFENTKNLYIEGDNLDALKLLQETYLGKVKMIYIDPPYNTGSDFIYEDDFTAEKDAYQRGAGEKDDEGNRMMDEERWRQNTTSNGRFHSDWLSMIYPRLKLARNLLCDDGLIFISLDDVEVANLRGVMSEVFGADNFLACIAWEKRYTRSNNARLFYSLKDNIIAYRKGASVDRLREPRSEDSAGLYTNQDNDPRGPWMTSSYVNPATKDQRPNLVYSIQNPSTLEQIDHPTHAWKYSVTEHGRHVSEKRLWWGQKGDAKYPRLKQFLEEMDDGMVPIDLWDYKSSGTTDEGGLVVKDLFGGAVFDNPKPPRLIRRMISLIPSLDPNDIILDFFSGSATTAHAVMQLNAEDGGKRRHIMVQLPEPCDEKSEAFKAGYKTIAEIGKERIRRAGKKILSEWQAKQAKEKPAQGDLLDPSSTISDPPSPPDTGFRVLKIDSSNFADIHRTPDELNQKELALHTEHIKPERTPEDLLFQVLVDWGVDLALPITAEIIDGKQVFFVDGSNNPTSRPALAACFDAGLTDGLVKAIAARQPLRAVFRDESYGDDSTRINVEQIFKLLSPGTEIKSL